MFREEGYYLEGWVVCLEKEGRLSRRVGRMYREGRILPRRLVGMYREGRILSRRLVGMYREGRKIIWKVGCENIL